MACTNKTNMWIQETLIDPWGGEVQLIDVASDLQSIMVNIKTPWGSTYNYVEIDKGSTKTYTSGEKIYSIQMTLAGYVSDNYIGQIIVCYEFVQKLDTTTSMIYDSEASQLVEDGKLFFDCKITDENGVVLEHYDVQIYRNGVWIGYAPGVWRYEYIVTTDDIDNTLVFQGKFEGTEGFNASQSNEIIIQIPGKVETNLSICSYLNSDNCTITNKNVYINETISFEGTLKDENNNVISNQTVYLVYKGIDNQYGYVLDKDGYRLVASTDSNGNYYRPWEPTEEYLDYSTYAMYFDGNDDYISTYSSNIIVNVTPEKPECIDYTTQSECEVNNCYWWSDNTCQSTPDGTTEYLDVYIKPYPWYDGKYEEAISNTLQKVTELTGKITNYMSTVTGYEYKGIDILEEQNQEVVVVRVYFAEIPETSLMPPVIIGGILGIIAGILLLSIGYIIGTSESEFSKEEVIVKFDDACDKAINECKERYPGRTTIKEEAANFKHCVGGIETVRIIGSSDVVEEDYSKHVDYVINPVIIDLDKKLDDGTLLPEDIDDAINDNLTIPTKEVVDLRKDKARDEDCAWELLDTCIITKKALKTLTWGVIGIGTIYTLSTVKKVTK